MMMRFYFSQTDLTLHIGILGLQHLKIIKLFYSTCGLLTALHFPVFGIKLFPGRELHRLFVALGVTETVSIKLSCSLFPSFPQQELLFGCQISQRDTIDSCIYFQPHFPLFLPHSGKHFVARRRYVQTASVPLQHSLS